MTRKQAVELAVGAIAAAGLVAGMRHCLKAMAPSADRAATVEFCGRRSHGCRPAERAKQAGREAEELAA